MCDLTTSVERIRRNDNGTGFQDSIERHQELRDVGHQNANPIALLHAHIGQR